MLKLFQSIFGGNEKHGSYPESLIEMAIERAVDGTDPLLRALTGYRKRLRSPVIHAIDHVVALVDSLPAPLPAASSEYGNDPRLMALFASPEHMRETYAKSAALREYRQQHTDTGERINVLLLAERTDKNVLGIELAGDVMRRDVAQVAINFHNHRLVDPSSSEEEARRLLKRRAFDHLLSLVLLQITEAKGERTGLNNQRKLLRHKLEALKRAGWSFDEENRAHPDPAVLQAELNEIEKQIAEMGADKDTLHRHLDITTELLANAERHFWSETVDLHLDRMNIQRSPEDTSAHHIRLQEIRNARGRQLVMLLVSLNYDELPQRKKMSDMAGHHFP